MANQIMVATPEQVLAKFTPQELLDPKIKKSVEERIRNIAKYGSAVLKK